MKVSKSVIFLVKSFLGNFYRHLVTFIGHADAERLVQEIQFRRSGESFFPIVLSAETTQDLRAREKTMKLK